LTPDFSARLFWLGEERKAFITQREDGTPGAEIGDQQGDLASMGKRRRAALPPTERQRRQQSADKAARVHRIVADLPLDRELVQDVIRRTP
jgi:putative transposase